MKQFSIDLLYKSAQFKPVGYIEACLSLGVVNGDTITFTDKDFSELKEKFTYKNSEEHSSSGCGCCGGKIKPLST